MWTSGNYEYAEMQKYVKCLDRPVPGAGGTRITGLGESEPTDALVGMVGVPEAPAHLPESLFLVPGSLSEEGRAFCRSGSGGRLGRRMRLSPSSRTMDKSASTCTRSRSIVDSLCAHLVDFGFKPREFPFSLAGAKGVGGQAAFVKSAEVPVGIQGACGVVTLHVVESEVPFLLPMSFCKSLGIFLNTTNNTATWKTLEKVSKVVNLDTDHIAISLAEFPLGG